MGSLLVAMIAAPLAASPEPSALAIAFRTIGAALAAYLLWVATRNSQISSDGSGIGAAAEIVIAAGVFAAGWYVVPVKPLAGPLAALAAGITLVAVAVVPMAGRNVMRVGTGAALMALGLSLILTAWAGPTPALGQLALMTLIVGILGATSLLMTTGETDADAPSAAPSAETEAGDAEAGSNAADVPAPENMPVEEVAPATRTARRGAGKSGRSNATGESGDGSGPAAGDSTGADANAAGLPAEPAPESETEAGATPPPAPEAGASSASAPAAAPAAAAGTGPRITRTRSPRAMRQGATAGPVSQAANQTPDATGDETEAAPQSPPPARVRRLRPREPRQ